MCKTSNHKSVDPVSKLYSNMLQKGTDKHSIVTSITCDVNSSHLTARDYLKDPTSYCSNRGFLRNRAPHTYSHVNETLYFFVGVKTKRDVTNVHTNTCFNITSQTRIACH